MTLYICVDFDGTIVDHAYPSIGDPVPDAIKWMKRWIELDAQLILFTMRPKRLLHEAMHYLDENDLKFYGYNHNPTQREWTDSPKAHGHIYVDDAAFGCPLTRYPGFLRACVDWSIVGPVIEVLLLNKKERGKRSRGENEELVDKGPMFSDGT